MSKRFIFYIQQRERNMKKIITTLLLITSFNSSAMLCEIEGLSPFFSEKLTVEVSKDHSELRLNVDGNESIKKINSSAWDGHVAGIITANDLSIKFENHFGCFRNVELTGLIPGDFPRVGSIKFGNCRGGSTPDDLCLR